MWGRPGTKAVYITPGSPWENRYCESFNGSLRDECLNVHWFESMEEARARIEAWRIDHNESRPHQALQEETPAQFAMRAKGLERSVSLSTAEN
jgi:putative transposase